MSARTVQTTWHPYRVIWICGLVLGGIGLLCGVGPILSPYAVDTVFWEAIGAPPSRAHWLGTDANGRDLLIRLLQGGQVSLVVGAVASLVSLVIGVAYGAIAGFMGGRVDALMMRLVDILYALPFLFFVILLLVLFDRNILLVFVAIGAVEWLDMARIVRGQTLTLKGQDFVRAAHALGVPHMAIIRRHIVPNCMGPVLVYMTLMVPKVILLESFLSFLGLGVQEPYTSWGVLIAEGVDMMESAWWMLVFPSVLLGITLFCFNFLGDGLRDLLGARRR